MKTSAVTNWALFDAAFKLPGSPEKTVLLQLIYHRNNKTFLCCPGYTRLCKETGYAKEKLSRCLLALKDAGFIEWQKGGGNQHTGGVPNRYILNLEAIEASLPTELTTDEELSSIPRVLSSIPKVLSSISACQVRPSNSNQEVINQEVINQEEEPSTPGNLEDSFASPNQQNDNKHQEALSSTTELSTNPAVIRRSAFGEPIEVEELQ